MWPFLRFISARIQYRCLREGPEEKNAKNLDIDGVPAKNLELALAEWLWAAKQSVNWPQLAQSSIKLRNFPLNILQDFKTLADKRDVYSARQLSAGATDF